MSAPRFSAVPPYARDVVPALGWTLFSCRAAWPALSGARPMTTTNWVLSALLAGVALWFFARAARAGWVRVEGDQLTRWSAVRGWRKERRPLASVAAAGPVPRGTAIGFDDGVVWLVPGAYRGGEALGRWVIARTAGSDPAHVTPSSRA